MKGIRRHTTKTALATTPTNEGGMSPHAETKPRPKKREPTVRSITGRRLWLFRCAAVTIGPVVLLLLLELSLRVVGYGYSPAAIVKCQVNGNDAWCDNIQFGWRFFPRRIAREFVPFAFPAVKPENGYRIFVLGASAVKGEPDSTYSFGRILRTMLREAYPETDFEVTIAAMPAINSHVVVEIAKDCAKHQPDLFIVYLGNNEVTGPHGAGTVFAPPFRHITLIRAAVALKTTRLGQMAAHVLERVGDGRNESRAWHGLEMFLRRQIPVTDKRLQTVYEHFDANLRKIADVAARNGSKLILCTVGSNLKDCPPFASLHEPQLQEDEKKRWNDLYESGIACESADDYANAITHYLAASEIDSRYADLQFRLGRCYWTLADYDKARERYIRAREVDTLRFRADARINEVIRDCARSRAGRGVYLVDAAKTFEQNSPHETPGEELFYEHVHMNFTGNYLLARALAEKVHDVLPRWIKRQRKDEHPALSETECARRLAYTEWARYNNAYKILNFYIKEPPFTNQLYHKEQVKEMDTKLMELQARLTPQALKDTAVLFQHLLQKDPSDIWLRWKYAELLSVHLNDEEAAAEQCRMAQKLLPCSYRSHLLLALSLERRNRWSEAEEHLLKVVQLKPASAEAHYHLGLIYQAQARIEDSIECFSRAIHLQPNNPKAYMNLAVLLSRRGETDTAIEVLREGTQSVPNDPVLHFNLGVLLARRQRTAEAITEFRTALRIDPNSSTIRDMLESTLSQRN